MPCTCFSLSNPVLTTLFTASILPRFSPLTFFPPSLSTYAYLAMSFHLYYYLCPSTVCASTCHHLFFSSLTWPSHLYSDLRFFCICLALCHHLSCSFVVFHSFCPSALPSGWVTMYLHYSSTPLSVLFLIFLSLTGLTIYLFYSKTTDSVLLWTFYHLPQCPHFSQRIFVLQVIWWPCQCWCHVRSTLSSL